MILYSSSPKAACGSNLGWQILSKVKNVADTSHNNTENMEEFPRGRARNTEVHFEVKGFTVQRGRCYDLYLQFGFNQMALSSRSRLKCCSERRGHGCVHWHEDLSDQRKCNKPFSKGALAVCSWRSMLLTE